MRWCTDPMVLGEDAYEWYRKAKKKVWVELSVFKPMCLKGDLIKKKKVCKG